MEHGTRRAQRLTDGCRAAESASFAAPADDRRCVDFYSVQPAGVGPVRVSCRVPFKPALAPAVNA